MSGLADIEKSAAQARGGKYLTFALGSEGYGLEILRVREIIGYMDITAVPRAPAFVKGVINLRGQVITVVDLRSRFGMPVIPRTAQTCIIVVEINSASRRVCMGIIVDRVSEVLSIPNQNIEDAPDFGANIDTSFILGMGKVGQSVKILLDINKILSTEQAPVVGAQGA